MTATVFRQSLQLLAAASVDSDRLVPQPRWQPLLLLALLITISASAKAQVFNVGGPIEVQWEGRNTTENVNCIDGSPETFLSSSPSSGSSLFTIYGATVERMENGTWILLEGYTDPDSETQLNGTTLTTVRGWANTTTCSVGLECFETVEYAETTTLDLCSGTATQQAHTNIRSFVRYATGCSGGATQVTAAMTIEFTSNGSKTCPSCFGLPANSCPTPPTCLPPPTLIPQNGCDDNICWGDAPYDHMFKPVPFPNVPYTIGEMGCALTSAVMLVNYYAEQQHVNVQPFNPFDLDSFLRDTLGGYDAEGGIEPWAVAAFARLHGIQMYFSGELTDEQRLNEELLKCNPVMLWVSSRGARPDHWVLATRRHPDLSTYEIRDPGGYTGGDTLAAFDNSAYAMWLFSPTRPQTIGGMKVVAYSPIELLITDPSGRRTGVTDPTTGESVRDIPTSSYGHYVLRDDVGHSAITPETKAARIVAPEPGDYRLRTTGTGLGTYGLDFLSYDNDGGATLVSTTGITGPGSVVDYVVNYDGTPGHQGSVKRVATFASAIDDVVNSRGLGLIDNSGIANALKAKLDEASRAAAASNLPSARGVLTAFVNLVTAQTGKHIIGIAPQVLLEDAASLESELW